MWESIKRFFGFGKKEKVDAPVFEGKTEPKVVEAPVVKVETPKKTKAPKAKPTTEEKVTAKEIKAKVKKEPKSDKTEVKKSSTSRKRVKKGE